MKKLFLVGLIAFLIITGCNKPTTIATQSPDPYPSQNNVYPDPGVGISENTAYPGSTAPIVVIAIPTSTMDPLLGSITGRLLRNGQPVPLLVLDLAEVMLDESGNDLIAGLDRITSPNTTTDDQGIFTFINIKEGRYALILDIVTNQFLLNYPGREDSIIVQVEAGKMVELGDLDYDELPVP